MYKNVLFDLYGTLVDIHTDEHSEEFWNSLIDTVREKTSLSAKELKGQFFLEIDIQEKRRKEEHPNIEYAEIDILCVFKKMFSGCTYSELLDISNEFRRLSRKYIQVYPGVFDLLEELKAKGRKIYLLSNAQRVFTAKELIDCRLNDFFDGIVLSSDEGCKKPDKLFFNTLIERYELNKNETVMVGNDAYADIKGAYDAGIDSVYLESNLSNEVSGKLLSKHSFKIEEIEKLIKVL